MNVGWKSLCCNGIGTADGMSWLLGWVSAAAEGVPSCSITDSGCRRDVGLCGGQSCQQMECDSGSVSGQSGGDHGCSGGCQAALQMKTEASQYGRVAVSGCRMIVLYGKVEAVPAAV